MLLNELKSANEIVMINLAYIGLEMVVNEWKSMNAVLNSTITYEIELLLINGMVFKCLLNVNC